MPTENRSSNTEIKPCPFCGGKAESRCTAGPDPDWFVQCTECRASADVFSEDNLTGWNNRALAAEQHQGETVKYLDLVSGNVFDDAEPIEQAVRRAIPIADPAEVEQPSQIALSLQTKLKSVESDRDRLRAKLAEQEHSARELLRIIGMSVQGSAAYNRAVVAFHDSLNADTKPN